MAWVIGNSIDAAIQGGKDSLIIPLTKKTFSWKLLAEVDLEHSSLMALEKMAQKLR